MNQQNLQLRLWSVIQLARLALEDGDADDNIPEKTLAAKNQRGFEAEDVGSIVLASALFVEFLHLRGTEEGNVHFPHALRTETPKCRDSLSLLQNPLEPPLGRALKFGIGLFARHRSHDITH